MLSCKLITGSAKIVPHKDKGWQLLQYVGHIMFDKDHNTEEENNRE